MIRTGLLFTLVALALAAAFSWYGWTHTEPGAQIPVHFDLSGQPDRYGSRAEAFLVMPAFLVGLAFLMSLVPMIDPRGENVRRSRPVYLAGWIIGALTIALAQGFVTWTALGGQAEPGMLARGVSLLLATTMLVLGIVLAKARPNFFVGIRTPWTLSSDLSWDKTHRWGGRLYLGFGLLGLILALAGPVPAVAVILIVALVAISLGLVIYSYLVWKGDPARETLAPDDA